MNRSETFKLRNIVTTILGVAGFPALAASQRHDTVAGWDEMQGYPETYGYDTVGAPWGGFMQPQAFRPAPAMNPFAAMMQARQGGLPGAPQLPPGAVQALQGGPRRLLSYMGLGSLGWTNSDTQTEKTLEAEPQAAFRGRRLVISQAKSDGAAGILVTVSNPLTVSGMPQTPAPDQAAPVEMFEAATTYSMLDLQIATSATKITLGITVSAIPDSGETVVVAAGLYGEWLR